ncbi:MAG: hypothetical protein ABIN89_15175 [Chitinophagaceae bacterium]
MQLGVQRKWQQGIYNWCKCKLVFLGIKDCFSIHLIGSGSLLRVLALIDRNIFQRVGFPSHLMSEPGNELLIYAQVLKNTRGSCEFAPQFYISLTIEDDKLFSALQDNPKGPIADIHIEDKKEIFGDILRLVLMEDGRIILGKSNINIVG